MFGLYDRARQAAADLNEVLGAVASAPGQAPGAVPGPSPGQPPQLGPLPRAPGPQGTAQSAPQGPQMQRPNPLQMMGSFKSPPLAAALQGPQGAMGHPAASRPIGFAEGGFVVRAPNRG